MCSYICNQCRKRTVKTVSRNAPAAGTYQPRQERNKLTAKARHWERVRERWRTVVETTQSECCYTVSAVLHIITCCFTADGTLSKQCRGKRRRAEREDCEMGLRCKQAAFRFTLKEEVVAVIWQTVAHLSSTGKLSKGTLYYECGEQSEWF